MKPKAILRWLQERPLVWVVLSGAGGFLLGTTEEVVLKNLAADLISKSLAGAVTAMLIVLAILLALSVSALDVMCRLDRRVGIKVRYYQRDASAEIYIKCQGVIAQAKKTIDVLNSYMVEGHEDIGSSRERQEREKYYAALLDRVGKSDVVYRRIVQVRSDKSNLHQMHEDAVHEKHLRDVALLASGIQQYRVSLLQCPPKRLTTFVLVDGVHLIWQINEVTTDKSGNERLNLQGAFIIHDPNKKITGQFEDYFAKLVLDRTTTHLSWPSVHRQEPTAS
jgi:hypothetical protein